MIRKEGLSGCQNHRDFTIASIITDRQVTNMEQRRTQDRQNQPRSRHCERRGIRYFRTRGQVSLMMIALTV